MPRVDEDVLAHQDPTPVFVAATLGQAKQAEALLDSRGVFFIVSVEPVGRTLFGTLRHGAVFSVSASQASYCARLLIDAGLEIGVLEDPSG
jgi:hypothetical protein